MEIPADPLALRARLHAWAAAVADAPKDRALAAAWDRYRAAWWALPEDARRRAEAAFFAKHGDCPMADFGRCPLARKAVAAMIQFVLAGGTDPAKSGD